VENEFCNKAEGKFLWVKTMNDRPEQEFLEDLIIDEEEDTLPPTDPVEAAEAAGLYYVMDGEPGYTRLIEGDGFVYLDLKRQPINNPKKLARLNALVIPPAWTDVWICSRANGHIQATGRDKKGRKQYRYHADWNAIRSLTKFGRLAAFGEALPAIRASVDADLRGAKLSHARVVALVVRLLERTLIRVGNQEYARQNNSYGLTTLLDDHITVEGSRMTIEFVGKRGKQFEVDVRDRRLSKLVKRCQELPGQNLFQYVDENGDCCQSITSGDVNTYLRQVTGQDFTAKDFRTWGGTTLAAMELYQRGPAETEKQAEKQIVQVVKIVAEALGNTPAICRGYYIHPVILDTYRDGSLFELMGTGFQQAHEPDETSLTIDEQAVLHLLRARLR
jgi:DNA topoisomerase I